MKKYLALLLAFMMIFFCAACSSAGGTPEGDTAGEEATDVAENSDTDVQGPVLIEEATGEGFACLVLDNGECYWAVGLTTPEQVEMYFSIKSAPRTYIQFVPVGESDDPIDDPDAIWQMQVVGDEIPDWFLEEEDKQETAWNALAEWRAVAKTAEPVEAVYNTTITIPEETGEGFACVLRKDGKVFWELGVDSPAQLVEMNELESVSKLLIQVVQTSDEDNSWQIQIIGDEIPNWFTSIERMEFNVRDALEDWKEASAAAGQEP